MKNIINCIVNFNVRKHGVFMGKLTTILFFFILGHISSIILKHYRIFPGCSFLFCERKKNFKDHDYANKMDITVISYMCTRLTNKHTLNTNMSNRVLHVSCIYYAWVFSGLCQNSYTKLVRAFATQERFWLDILGCMCGYGIWTTILCRRLF